MPDKPAKKPREMTPEAQKLYDTFTTVLGAVSFTFLLALAFTICFALATPITHLEPVSPFAVFGTLAGIELSYWRVRQFWREWER